MPPTPRRRSPPPCLALKPGLDRSVRRLQPRAFHARSDLDGAPLRRSRRPGDRGVPRLGARVRPGAERHPDGGGGDRRDGRRRRRRSCAPSRPIARRRSTRSATAGSAAAISPRSPGSCTRCCATTARSRGSSPRATPPTPISVEAGLESFSSRAMALDLKAIYGRAPARARAWAISSPARRRAARASASTCSCAGWCARDAVDLGLWSAVRPAQLVVPLDTHIIRVGRCLGDDARVSPGWRMARRHHAHAASS